VTGGAGFIGRVVVAGLAATADRVVVFDSLRPDVHRGGQESARARLAAIGADLVVGDVRHITASSERIQDELGWHATVSLGEGVSGLTFG